MFSKEELEQMEKESSSQKEKNTQSTNNLYRGVLAPQYQPLFEPSPTFLILEHLKSMNNTDEKQKKREGK